MTPASRPLQRPPRAAASAFRTTTMPNRPTFHRALVRVLPLVLAACASQGPAPDAQAPGPAMRTTPLKTTNGMSPDLADAARRAQEPGLPSAEERARIFRGTGVLVKGQQPGGGMPPGQSVQATGNSIVLNFEGADLREVVRSILGDTLGEAYTIDASVGGTVTLRTTTGHRARSAARDPRDAAADERRRDGEGGRHLQDPAAGRGRPRQPDAAARQFAARASAGLLRPDRPAALHRRTRDDADPGAVREGRERGPARRAAQHADPVRHRAGASSTSSKRSTCSTSTGWPACRWECSRCRTPT